MIGDLFDSPWKIAIIAILIIVLFGSRKLPGAARSLGQSMRILKKEMSGLHEEDEPGAPGAPATAADATPAAAPAQLQAAPARPPRAPRRRPLTRRRRSRRCRSSSTTFSKRSAPTARPQRTASRLADP